MVFLILSVSSVLSSPQIDLASEISPISQPDLEGAKVAVQNLNKLAEIQYGKEKANTQNLALVIKKLFTAEFNVSEQLEAYQKAQLEALRLEKSADSWEIPNAFGSVNLEAAHDTQNSWPTCGG